VVARVPKRILVVDDNVDAALTLQTLLNFAGHDVIAVHTPQSALDALSPQPDVVVLDIGLPGMDGYELARQIRAKMGVPPLLIAVTGWGTPNDRMKARQAGFDFHFTKPADPEHLIRTIEDCSPLAN
jgi:CheY-like chemotaxis protein